MVWKAIKKAATAAIGPAIGGAVEGGINYAGAKESARMSKEVAREQMAFQERMSSTAYQRAASDLEAAGLNRILALGSPASTPGGAMAQIPDMSRIGSGIMSGASSAANIALTQEQTGLTTQNLKNAIVQEGILTQDQMRKTAQTKVWEIVGDFIVEAMKIIKDSPEGAQGLVDYLQGGTVLDDLRWAAKGVENDIKNNITVILENLPKLPGLDEATDLLIKTVRGN